jgi:oligopeptide transport system substrate-binding protein
VLPITAVLLVAGCEQIKRPAVEPFYAVKPSPLKQELRWSNGKLPAAIDPAKAAAPPETDIVRALFDGLTDLDSNTLKAIPAIAERWESSPNKRVWTFHLRKDAKWSNGDRVVAGDFVRSWKRLRGEGFTTAKRTLTTNIEGFSTTHTTDDAPDFIESPTDSRVTPSIAVDDGATRLARRLPQNTPTPSPDRVAPQTNPTPAAEFGVEAPDDDRVIVKLESPDPDLPALVADPVFRPVHSKGMLELKTGNEFITNGAFEIEAIEPGSLILIRSESYWNSRSVALERIRFIELASSEAALQAYRDGELDVITNAYFEPGALKLLTPFDDFKRATHAALNFYEFNHSRPPFSDRRVRLALAMAIDRERLADGELAGTVEPAYSFLPPDESKEARFEFNVDAAKASLTAAGFPNGNGFPTVRLVVNRNNTQQRIARAVVKMWKADLNIDSEIIVKEAGQMNAVRESGEFDLMRRGVVLPSPNETISLRAIFDRRPGSKPPALIAAGSQTAQSSTLTAPNSNTSAAVASAPSEEEQMTELSAVYDVEAIPLYFPRSYALVQPYVQGFHLNGIDFPSISSISVDTEWVAAGVF